MKQMKELKGLEPAAVFSFFEEICGIPHGSGNVRMISDYLCDFAEKRGLWYSRDDSLNVIIKKPASDVGRNAEPVILQGHMDMVAVKTQDCGKDMDTEGLDIYVDGGYVTAHGTSLGADDGIAVAYMLAILDSSDCEHPPIEAVFTVDEEIGMLGAAALDTGSLDGRRMLNIDSEDEGVFLSGCAGGATVKGEYRLTSGIVKGEILDIDISGLTSGHSGTDIILQRANANIIAGRLLFAVRRENVRIVTIHGGEKDNSIAPSAHITLVTENQANEISDKLTAMAETLKNEYAVTDPEMQIAIKNMGVQEITAFDAASSEKVTDVLNYIPDGVVKMSNDIDGLVQTSLNLGVVRCETDVLAAVYLIRSSMESEKNYLVDKVCAITELLGGKITISGVYPAWEYRRDSLLRNVMCESYREQYGEAPKVETIHAGVECGIMASKLEGLDCISFGPDILDIHTVKERLDIESVGRTWKLIINVLGRLCTAASDK